MQVVSFVPRWMQIMQYTSIQPWDVKLCWCWTWKILDCSEDRESECKLCSPRVDLSFCECPVQRILMSSKTSSNLFFFQLWFSVFLHSRCSHISVSSTFLPSRAKVYKWHRGHAPNKGIPRDICGYQSCKYSLFLEGYTDESKLIDLGHFLAWCVST